MATILLSAAGAALGSGFGGTVLGLSGAVIGRAVGATLGRVIDSSLMGSGSGAVETGKVDRFRLMGAGEGAPVGRVWGRVRVGGHVIWASRFVENAFQGGKGLGGARGTEFSYSVSLAVALCEGVITRVGRVWADGTEIERDSLNLRVYTGAEDQLPDPKISVVEGAQNAPAFRGIAYVVIEDLDLGRFGNRVPQFSFEVIRPAQGRALQGVSDLRSSVAAVAMMPGTGEFALATTPVHVSDGPGANRSLNVNSPSGKTDFATSLEHLTEEAPQCKAVSLIVSWFGSDLRLNACQLRPKVEQAAQEGEGQVWSAGGIGRAQAQVLPEVDGRVIYGGTPSDASVTEAISALRAAGQDVMFYPFILMEQLAGNGLPDPWSEAPDQPVLPWRGRITLSVAPGRVGSADMSPAAEAEVAAFFGTAQPGDFAWVGGKLSYGGAPEWSYRRFILHYAHLCAAAGGVDAFCIGSEMRGMTQVRGAGGTFPAVVALRQLAADVRSILGPATKISYAADWSEYFGYTSPEGDRLFHLDPLWADSNIDFIGIDNYMPLSDWREGEAHADVDWGSIYNLDYLKANVCGGEGFDWYYEHPAAEALQLRTPIRDEAHGEDWIWRYKDVRGWWDNQHHDRVGGVRAAVPSPWEPRSKPIWFTELGCAAIDKGTNQPNVFLDPKSSESRAPKYSTGRRDDFMQMQYLRAVSEYWSNPTNNPTSDLYEGPMLDISRAFVWAWDARPFPQFPGFRDLWSDGENYARGHWLNGRISNDALSAVVAEICDAAGVHDADVSRLTGVVRGYAWPEGGTARQALQPLMLTYGFDAVERDGTLRFQMRDAQPRFAVSRGELAVNPEMDADLELIRASHAETAGRIRLGFVEAEADFEVRSAEAVFPDEETQGIAQSEVSLCLTKAEGRATARRWLAEARIARDTARFTLPPSHLQIGAGDVIDLADAGRYRIDRAETALGRSVEAVRVGPTVYVPVDDEDDQTLARSFVAPVPTFPMFLDLPLLSGREDPFSPHVAVSALPWPGAVAVWGSASDSGYAVEKLVVAPSMIGVTLNALASGPIGVWDRGAPLRVRLTRGQFSSATAEAVLNGANLIAIGNGTSDRWEVLQFQQAQAVAPGEWDLHLRLRGLAGTEISAQDQWPAGSYVVVLDRTVTQLDSSPAFRGLARHYRIGVAGRGYDDPATVHRIEAFAGVGLRPLAPVHLRHKTLAAETLFEWKRRGRLDGDNWVSADVPLGEAFERYVVRISKNGSILRVAEVEIPQWTYSKADQTSDGAQGECLFEVAQVSEIFGPGVFRRLIFSVP